MEIGTTHIPCEIVGSYHINIISTSNTSHLYPADTHPLQ